MLENLINFQPAGGPHRAPDVTGLPKILCVSKNEYDEAPKLTAVSVCLFLTLRCYNRPGTFVGRGATTARLPR